MHENRLLHDDATVNNTNTAKSTAAQFAIQSKLIIMLQCTCFLPINLFISTPAYWFDMHISLDNFYINQKASQFQVNSSNISIINNIY